MSELRCPCGHPIDLSALASPYGFRMVHEQRIEPLAPALAEAPVGVPPEQRERATRDTLCDPVWAILRAYECERCLRFSVLRLGSEDDVAASFVRDPEWGTEAGTPLAALAAEPPRPPPRPESR